MLGLGASTFAEGVDNGFLFTVVISIISLVGIVGFIGYCLIKYNHKANKHPSNSHGSVKAEIIWTVIPFILVMIMFGMGYKSWKATRIIPEDAYKIKVIGGKWYWSFEYPNGLVQNGEQGLTIPKDRPVAFELISRDIIHAFSVPAFRIKLDVTPRAANTPNNMVWVEADKAGTYDIYCAEYCGIKHSKMLSKVHVIEPTDFDVWVKEEQIAAASRNVLPGEVLYKSKGCFACHSTDGSKGIGPSLKSIWGKEETVVTNGTERKVKVDAAYIIKSLQKPNADVVKGFVPSMPVQNLSEQENKDIVEFIKSLAQDK